VDLSVGPGETFGVVGESGCGKSMTGLSIMGLLPPGGAVVGGSIKLDGRELVGLTEPELRKIRGNDMAMIFQDPLTSLDPTKTIGYQVAEPVRLHRGASKRKAMERAAEMLSLVGLPRPKERLGDFPHQLSGGLRPAGDNRDSCAAGLPRGRPSVQAGQDRFGPVRARPEPRFGAVPKQSFMIPERNPHMRRVSLRDHEAGGADRAGQGPRPAGAAGCRGERDEGPPTGRRNPRLKDL
jgi:ABC-type phosphonate transport system ATPase subunit